jgi:hypothetical protein
MSSSVRSRTDSIHTPSWILGRLLVTLDGTSDLADELRLAVGPNGVRDTVRLRLTTLGVISVARRAGCRHEDLRFVVEGFVRGVLADRYAANVVDRAVGRCASIVAVVTAMHRTEQPVVQWGPKLVA